ncbi:hypothetical protein [Buttiauxella sp.]|uniref:hypothetical protein n=1 Tax=Buttiauxella sp. TaxID=1972222 RepID=UPI003C787C26
MTTLWQTALNKQAGCHPELALYNLEYINKLVWMKDVPEIRSNEALWHMHPVVFLDSLGQNTGNRIPCSFCQSGIEIKPELLIHCFGISSEKADLYAPLLTNSFIKYDINNCLRISHFLGQIGVENQMLTKFREGFYYTDSD